MAYMNGCLLDRMVLLKTWSRHHNHSTPKSMRDVWSTSYSNEFSGKKIGYYPDRTIVDYFSGESRWVPSRQSRQGDNLRTSLNSRAKSGFRYWVLDKPKVSHFWRINSNANLCIYAGANQTPIPIEFVVGRYGTGSYKTVLGIGNAPRT